MVVSSPCTGLCSFERRTGFCIGCARTRDEILSWRGITEDKRLQISLQLAARKTNIGFVRRLPWSLEDVRNFVVATYRGAGTWVTGVYGAIGAFRHGLNEAVTVELVDNRIAAFTLRAAISLELSDKTRAYIISSTPKENQRDDRPASKSVLSCVVVIAVSRSFGLEVGAPGLTSLGPDRDAIMNKGCKETHFDFGFRNRAGGFGIRTADETLAEVLRHHLGEEVSRFFPVVGDLIIRASPTTIVRNPIGRVEVAPSGWSRSADTGPYTHFSPLRLQSSPNESEDCGMIDSYLPCAVHYPESFS